MTQKRFYRFCYSLGGKRDRLPDLHSLRDGDAFIELYDILRADGWEFGGPLFNLPLPDYPDESKEFLHDLGPTDLLVLSTRSPLNDVKNGVGRKGSQDETERNDRKSRTRLTVLPGGTAVEQEIHKALACCFLYCNRKCIRLTKPLVDQLPEVFADRAHILFRQYRPKKFEGADPREVMAAYKSLRAEEDGEMHDPPQPDRTAVFVIRMRLWDGGPWILSAFAMSGDVALIWAHLLRIRHQDLLLGNEPLFFMGELILGDFPPRPFTLKFAETRKVITVLRTHEVPGIAPEDQYSPPRQPKRPRSPNRGRGRSRAAGDRPPAL